MNYLNEVLVKYNIQVGGQIKIFPSYANEVWLYESPNSNKFVIKNHKALKEKSITQLHKNIETLQQYRINIPNIIKNINGDTLTKVQTELFDITEYIEHRNLNYKNYNTTENDLFKAGQILHQLHALPCNKFVLSKINFEVSINGIIDIITKYKKARIEKLLKDNNDKRLITIDKFLELDKNYISGIKNKFYKYKFIHASYVPTHGDFSILNTLIDKENKLYIIDWDKFKLRPAMFDLQRAIGLFCGYNKTNANLEEIKPERLKSFLSGYWEKDKPSASEITQLIEVQEYNSHFFWIEFTLAQLLNGDYRILDILSNNVEDNIYWLKPNLNSLEIYRNLLTKILNL